MLVLAATALRLGTLIVGSTFVEGPSSKAISAKVGAGTSFAWMSGLQAEDSPLSSRRRVFRDMLPCAQAAFSMASAGKSSA